MFGLATVAVFGGITFTLTNGGLEFAQASAWCLVSKNLSITMLPGVLVRAVTALGPVNRDPSEERFVAGETVSSGSDAEQK